MPEKLYLAPLEKAINQLETSLFYYHSEMVQKDPSLMLQLRAAAIQAFEFTYELSCKMIKRYLNLTSIIPVSGQDISFPDLIRTANDQGLLLSDVSVWKKYRAERGATSHTYDEEKAIEVFETIPEFLKEARFLLVKLKEANEKN